MFSKGPPVALAAAVHPTAALCLSDSKLHVTSVP